MTTEYITRPDHEKLFNGCVGYWDFNGDAKDCINGNDGTVSGATLTTNRFGMQNRAYSFNGTSDKITLGNIGNLRTVVLMVKLTSTTEAIFEGDPNAHLIHANSGSLTYPDWDDVYVDGVNTDIIDAGNWRLICITSSTDVACTDIELGLNNATYGDLDIAFCILYSRALSAGEVLALYNLTKYKPIYPYMRRTCQR